MTRQKEYNREEVLEAATLHFWKHGYEATSIGELVDETGINRSSMYEEFGGKDGLFLACIDKFGTDRKLVVADIENRYELGIPAIQGFITECSKRSEASGEGKGCMLANTIVENRSVSEKVYERVQGYFAEIEKWFCKMLTEAKKKGQVPKDSVPADLAKFVRVFLQGLAVMGRTSPDKRTVNKLVNTMINSLTK